MKITARQLSYSGLLALIVGNGIWGCYSAKTKQNELEQNKTEVLTKAPNKYKQLVEQSKNGKSVDWNVAVAEMRDSLRTDSIYTKGFKAGYRRAVDSINTMHAKDVYKTVSKVIK